MLKQIQDFIGVGGLVPFEHGFKNTIQYMGKKVWGVSDTHLYYNGGKVELIELDDDILTQIMNNLNSYLNYCLTEA